MPIVAKIQKILFTTRSLNLSPPSFAKKQVAINVRMCWCDVSHISQTYIWMEDTQKHYEIKHILSKGGRREGKN